MAVALNGTYVSTVHVRRVTASIVDDKAHYPILPRCYQLSQKVGFGHEPGLSGAAAIALRALGLCVEARCRTRLIEVSCSLACAPLGPANWIGAARELSLQKRLHVIVLYFIGLNESNGLKGSH